MIGGKSNDEMFKQLDSLMLSCEMGHASARTRHATTIAAQLRLDLGIAHKLVAELEAENIYLRELREERPNLLKALHSAECRIENLEKQLSIIPAGFLRGTATSHG